jgi:hypothetical protein
MSKNALKNQVIPLVVFLFFSSIFSSSVLCATPSRPIIPNPPLKIADVYTEWDAYLGFLVIINATGYDINVTWQKDARGGVFAFLSINWTTQLDRPILLGRYISFWTTITRLDTGENVFNFHRWIFRGAYFYNVTNPFLYPMPIFFHVNQTTNAVPLEITVQANGYPNLSLSSTCTSHVLVHITS